VQYHLRTHKERRLSKKILGHKLRKYAPRCVYDGLLALRYSLFKPQCRDAALPEIHYSDGSWTARETSSDLRQIQDFLRSAPAGLKIFQAGIGKSSLFGLMRETVSEVVGVTIVDDEIAYAERLFPADVGTKYKVSIANKYSADIATCGKGFDYIVDNDLSSYACCKRHVRDMLKAYREMLKPHGGVLVGLKGLGYFDTGFGLTEGRMRKIANEQGLSLVTNAHCYILQLTPPLAEGTGEET
jgi:hypothetical protein